MKNRTPTVSIIIANYNFAKYIGDALESVRVQSFRDWECIVIDDGSTDDSVKIIKRFCRRDARFRLIQKNHGGVSAARNAGLDIARGDYIAFLDSDDCFTDYAMEMLVHIARTTGADMIGGATTIVSDDFHFVPSKNISWSAHMTGGFQNPVAFLLMPQAHKWCWIWRRIYKRSLIGDTRFLPEFTGFGDDLTFMLDICWRAKSIIETGNVAVYHRAHIGTITNNVFSERNFEWFPTYFKHIHDNLLDKYDANFLCGFLRSAFNYLLMDTIFKSKHTNSFQSDARHALIESCKHIPRRYLTPKQRFLCWFLTCLK